MPDGYSCKVGSSGSSIIEVEDNFTSGYYPHEKVVVTVDGEKVSGSNMTAIGNAWGYKVARELFHSRKIVDKKYFNMI